MPLSEEDEKAIDEALLCWRQGDISLDANLEFVHLADLSCPHSPASEQVAGMAGGNDESMGEGPEPIMDQVPGLVMLSQTCDVVRSCRARPFLEIAPLIQVSAAWLEDIRRLKRPAFAYVPTVADDRLVADLDRTMTVEKALVAKWDRTPGWDTDEELRTFALALSRKRSRFAFPDDFVEAVSAVQRRMSEKHERGSEEGSHLRALREIRVRATPSWDATEVHLSWWFIKDTDPMDAAADWPKHMDIWLAQFDENGRFRLDPPTACNLEDMTARDYVESDSLDLDRLSVGRGA